MRFFFSTMSRRLRLVGGYGLTRGINPPYGPVLQTSNSPEHQYSAISQNSTSQNRSAYLRKCRPMNRARGVTSQITNFSQTWHKYCVLRATESRTPMYNYRFLLGFVSTKGGFVSSKVNLKYKHSKQSEFYNCCASKMIVPSFCRWMQFERFSEKELFRFCFRLPYDFCANCQFPYDFCVVKTAEVLFVLIILRCESA